MELYGGYLTQSHLAAQPLWQRRQPKRNERVFGDASALATSPGKNKDFNAESLTQTPAVSPVRQLSLSM
jgi:hypothetical protein